MPPRKLPPRTELRLLLGTMSQAEIAREYDTTRAAVSAEVQRMGLERRMTYDDYIPWKVKVAHQRDYNLRMLRLYAREQLDLPVDERDRRYLQRWKEYMDEHKYVVDYDPEEGFFHTQRRPRERNYVAIPTPDHAAQLRR